MWGGEQGGEKAKKGQRVNESVGERNMGNTELSRSVQVLALDDSVKQRTNKKKEGEAVC